MLIGIVGKKFAGKDTFALGLGPQFVNVKLADPLKDMLRTLYRQAGLSPGAIERKIEGDLKEEPCAILMGKTPRFAMQTLGTEWRALIGKELWSKIWACRVDSLEHVVCTDIRFHHEANEIRKRGGYMIRIDRPGLVSQDSHSSEMEQDEILCDLIFTNHRGIVHLKQLAEDWIKELL